MILYRIDYGVFFVHLDSSGECRPELRLKGHSKEGYVQPSYVRCIMKLLTCSSFIHHSCTRTLSHTHTHTLVVMVYHGTPIARAIYSVHLMMRYDATPTKFNALWISTVALLSIPFTLLKPIRVWQCSQLGKKILTVLILMLSNVIKTPISPKLSMKIPPKCLY